MRIDIESWQTIRFTPLTLTCTWRHLYKRGWLRCGHMLWYSWSVQRWSNLHWSAPLYDLLTCADNTALPGFLYIRAGRYDQKLISRYFSKLYRFHGIWRYLFFSCMTGVLTTFSTDWGKTAVDWLRMPYFSVMSEYCKRFHTKYRG